MTKRWSELEETEKRRELEDLYVRQNKSIEEIALILGMSDGGVYDRLLRLGIQSLRSQKPGFNNKRRDILIPKYSKDLAELMGILLGDGHVTNNQVMVTLGKKEVDYIRYVARLVKKMFGIEPKVIQVKGKYWVVYFGSVEVVRWLLAMGFVFNKVRQQVGIPRWILTRDEYRQGFIKGFFDTDGSVYKLKFGVQMAFTNRSIPLLSGVRQILVDLGYNPSKISIFRVYLTRREDIGRFFEEVGSANVKHRDRFGGFWSVGSPVGAGGGL